MSNMLSSLRVWLSELIDVITPPVCPVCGHALLPGEEIMCTQCRFDLPRVAISDFNDNLIHTRLAMVARPIARASSIFHYLAASAHSRLVTATKYARRPEIGCSLMAEHARSLMSQGFFDGIDLIVPVPVHWSKRLKRGYNQSAELARAVSSVTSIPMAEIISARRHGTQTHRSSSERLANARGTFYLSSSAPDITGRHILLIDDVITTGATIIACRDTIFAASPSSPVSVLTLAITRLR